MADPGSRAGVGYFNDEIFEYINKTHAPHDKDLKTAFDAPIQHELPAIMVGPSEAKLLRLLLGMIQAKKVIELGTLAGYSAISMAKALPEDGHLWTIESEEKNAQVARDCVEKSGLSKRITVLVGTGLALLPTLEEEGPFDAVFIDADKKNYDQYGRWAAKNLRPGGLLLGDNAIFFGNLLEKDNEAGAAMRRFHEESIEFFETVCIPTPDGLLLGIRK